MPSTPSRPPLRVGAVGYLNAMPLWVGLEGMPGVDLVPGPPAAVAAGLRAGEIDVALLPVVEILRQPGVLRIPGLGIAADRRVDSVVLLLRRPVASVRTLSLDRHSRTSQILARVCLDRLYGVRPALEEKDPRVAWAEGAHDAVLVIGDLALTMDDPRIDRLDLAYAWHELTGLPMVFAAWVARPGVLEVWPELPEMLARAADQGLANLDAVADRGRGPLDRQRARVYLRERIRYRLGPREEAGLARFFDEARRVLAGDGLAAPSASPAGGLAPPPADPEGPLHARHQVRP